MSPHTRGWASVMWALVCLFFLCYTVLYTMGQDFFFGVPVQERAEKKSGWAFDLRTKVGRRSKRRDTGSHERTFLIWARTYQRAKMWRGVLFLRCRILLHKIEQSTFYHQSSSMMTSWNSSSYVAQSVCQNLTWEMPSCGWVRHCQPKTCVACDNNHIRIRAVVWCI